MIPNLTTKKTDLSFAFHFYDTTMLDMYFREICKDLILRVQTNSFPLEFSTFHNLLNLPMFISEKIFNTFCKFPYDGLDTEQFSNGLVQLYAGNLQDRMNLYFDILDFSHDGFIRIEDAILFFLHLNSLNSHLPEKLCKNIIKNFFNGSPKLCKKDYCDTLLTFNSDIFYLMAYFLQMKIFFNEGNLFFLTDCVNENINKKQTIASRRNIIDQSELAEISEMLLQYLSFDDDIWTEINDKISDNHLENILESSSSSMIFSSQGKSHVEISAYFIHEAGFQPYKLVLLNNQIFCFKPNQMTGCLEYAFLLHINSSFVEKCESVHIGSKTYYPFQLNSNFNFKRTPIDIFCRSQADMEKIVNTIRAVTRYRNVIEYYTVEEEIGKGQYGRVKLGNNKLTGDKVAIKMLKKKCLDEKSLKMVRWEIEIFKFLQRVKHIGIVQAIDYFESLNTIYFVYEYISNGDLNTYLGNKTALLCKSELQDILRQIGDSIKFLHKYGIAHRDIKPENILLSFSDKKLLLKLTDFGLSKVMGVNEKSNDSYGSLCYLSPEILLKNPHNHKTDIWSFGVLVFLLKYGTLPFDDLKDSKTEIIRKIFSSKINLEFPRNEVNEYDVQLETLIRQCLSSSISKRPSMKQILKSDWFCSFQFLPNQS